jgi:hypothetical protein
MPRGRSPTREAGPVIRRSAAASDSDQVAMRRPGARDPGTSTNAADRISVALSRHLWTLQRFGFSPSKSPYRVANPGAPKVVCVSIPKAGTHLIERALCLHPKLYRKVLPTISEENVGRYGGASELLDRMRPGQVVVSHLRFHESYPEELRNRSIRGIFLIRDPHAIVVSQAHYVSRTPGHRHHEFFAAQEGTKARLRIAIAGDREHRVPSIGERLDAFAGWLDAGCLVVRFEDLIGPGGGGDPETQLGIVREIYTFLGLEADDQLPVSVCRRLFSSASPTFRRGSADGWRDIFDPELESLMDEVAGHAMARYGYGRAAPA